MNSWDCTLQVRAQPKARPRSVAGGHPYMPRKYMLWKKQLAAKLRENKAPLLNGNVKLCIVCYFLKHSPADVDNLAGGVMDAANGILYKDDRQVVEIRCRKQRALEDSISIHIEEVE